MAETVTTKKIPVEAPTAIFKPMSPEQEKNWLDSLKTDFKERIRHLTTLVRELNKVSVAIKLDNGTKDGKVQTLSVSLGSLNTDRYDDQKAMNIVELLKPVLSKDVYNVQETKISILSDDE